MSRARIGQAAFGLVALLLPLNVTIGSAALAAGPAAPTSLLPGAPLASLNATRERPLFNPTRRPPPLPKPQAPQPVAPRPATIEEPPRFTLLGIIRAPDRGGSVVLMDEAARASFSLKVGEGRRGWVLQSLDADAVTLGKNGRTVRLTYAKATQSPRSPVN